MQKRNIILSIIIIIIIAIVAIGGFFVYNYSVTSVGEGQTYCSNGSLPPQAQGHRHCGFGLTFVATNCPQIPGASCCGVCEKSK
jgi:hypothetical protein